MATPEIERQRLKALDLRRAAGANTWSPDRARCALRARICACLKIYEGYTTTKRAVAKGQKIKWPAQWMLAKAEELNAFDAPEAFEAFCKKAIGFAIL